MSLDTALYGILTGASTITAIVGTRISPVHDPEVGETRDRLIYQQVAGPRDHDCTGPSLARGYYQITAWSATHAGADTLCEAVRVLFKDGYRSGSVMGVFIRGQGDIPSLDTDEAATQYGKYLEIELVLKET